MGCYSCLKYLFIVLNFIFLVFGIAGVGVLVWILTDPTIPLHFTQEPNDFMIAAIIYLVAALILILLSVLGIYSVVKEVKWVLVVSFCLLLIVIVVEVASGVWIWTNRENLDEFTHASVKRTVQEGYGNENFKEMLDTIQSKLKCCGADHPTDWANIKEVNMAIVSKPTTYNIPYSCCRENVVHSDCKSATENIKLGEKPMSTYVYDKGCYTLIKEEIIMKHLLVFFSGFGTVVGFKILGLFIGLILMFSMNRSDHYKA